MGDPRLRLVARQQVDRLRPARRRDGIDKVYLYSLEQGKIDRRHRRLVRRPARPRFSGDGKYLFFVSGRDFNPIYSQHRVEPRLPRHGAHLLRDAGEGHAAPVRARSDERRAGEEAEEGRQEGRQGRSRRTSRSRSTSTASTDRIVALPVQAANYRNLQSVGSTLYYYVRGSTDAQPALLSSSTSARRRRRPSATSAATRSRADGKKMLVSKDGKYGIIDLPKAPGRRISEPLNLSGMEMKLDRQAEWKQIFHECWRQMRDFFYDPDLHGVDWKAMRKKYEPLVAHVNHRADLTYVIGEMIGELNVGHAYVGGGEMPKVAQGARGPARRRAQARPEDGYLPDHARSSGRQLGPERCARRSTEIGVERQGRRLHRRRQRPADQRDDEHLRAAGQHGRQAGDAEGEREAGGRRGAATWWSTPIADEADAVLLRLGAGQHQEGRARRPAARSATSTCPTCRRPASTSSPSTTTRSCARRR